MGTEKDDGGPAFPVVEHMGNGEFACDNFGMSLRDYTAIHAPPPPKWWMDCYAKRTNDLDTHAAIITQWNYVYADSMLEARKK